LRISRLARNAEQLLDHLEIARADILRWSMGAAVWWSFIDNHGTDRIRRFIQVDQPAIVAALPWMSEQERKDAGVVFDGPGLGVALRGPPRARW
jgi:pimeloyl-ACP methyl ester carboxylesterase